MLTSRVILLNLLRLNNLKMSKIINKKIEIEKISDLSNDYIEKKFQEMSLDVVRWAIVKAENNLLTISASVIEK